VDLPAGLRCGARSRKFYSALVEQLIAFGEHQFRQSKSLPGGGSVADHAQSAARQFERLGRRRKTVADAGGPECPEVLFYLWRWFLEILGGVASGFGPAVVTWADLAAWCALTGVQLAPWEARALIALGAARASIVAEEKPGNGGQGQNRSG
jgi:hypothetical protein